MIGRIDPVLDDCGVPLHRVRDRDALGRNAERSEALRIRLILRRDEGEARERRPNQSANESISSETALRKTPVDHTDRNAAPGADRGKVRPDFQLNKADDIRLNRVQETPDREGEIKRISHNRTPPLKDRPRPRKSSVGRRRNNDVRLPHIFEKKINEDADCVHLAD